MTDARNDRVEMSMILRYEVPVDDRIHTLTLPHGPVLHVGCRNPAVVEFWMRRDGSATVDRRFTVAGTGHPFSPGAEYVATAVAPGGSLVWHLLEIDPVRVVMLNGNN